LLQVSFAPNTLSTMMSLVKASCAVAALMSAACATELSKENWDEAVAGKTVFVKFLAPW